jgi:hypothetical protein
MKVYSKLPRGLTFPVHGVPVTIKRSNTPGCVIPGHGVTEVRDDTWAELVKAYGTHKAIRGEHIFAAEKVANAESIAEEREGEKTGMEQLALADLAKKTEGNLETSDDKSPAIQAISKKAEK